VSTSFEAIKNEQEGGGDVGLAGTVAVAAEMNVRLCGFWQGHGRLTFFL
jgi:hypothetical protein